MSVKTTEPANLELERAELAAVLQSELFVRSPTLAHFLSYLCEKAFAGESNQIKEYSVALDVFGRGDSFDQDTDSIVRVQANRLRKRLAEYYAGEGASHRIHITVPVGQYVPQFEVRAVPAAAAEMSQPAEAAQAPNSRRRKAWLALAGLVILIALGGGAYLAQQILKSQRTPTIVHRPQAAEPVVGLPVGDEIRILAGANRSYVDRAGKSWNQDAYFSGGTPVRSPVQHIWCTQDPTIYRTSRQGDFSYSIPLKPGTYELHLHFAETFYGPENLGGGGEGSRVMKVSANGKPLLEDFDVVTDSGAGRTADVKVFTDISPGSDGNLHLDFSSVKGGRGMVSAIELLPGTRERMRPVRIVARETPYYSNDSHWWSSDVYFKGGQLSASEESASETDDPELYETQRWGHFSYAIPVTPGKYTVILYFIERGAVADQDGPSGERVFSVYCNGKAIVKDLNISEEAGKNRALAQKITGLDQNAQGKLLLEFVPTKNYATISAIEVLPQ